MYVCDKVEAYEDYCRLYACLHAHDLLGHVRGVRYVITLYRLNQSKMNMHMCNENLKNSF